jgi:cation:H+ antiporter
MILFSLAVIASIILLVYSSDKFVDGAASIASHLNVSTLVIGITIIGFGTSAPEMLIASIASLEGKPELAIGNALGSNIANIALILGLTALFIPLTIHSKILKKELPVLIATTLIAGYLLFDSHLSTIDAIIMIAMLLGSLYWLTTQAKSHQTLDPLNQEVEQEIPDLSITQAWAYTLIGLIVLIASSKLFVWGAVGIAYFFGISDLVIGLTIIAIGTSLPELSASLAAAKKNEHDLVIGNVIGSNLFNTLGVLAIPGLLSPSIFSSSIIHRDLPTVIGLTLLLSIFLISFKNKAPVIGKFKALILIAIFVIYNITLFFQFS